MIEGGIIKAENFSFVCIVSSNPEAIAGLLKGYEKYEKIDIHFQKTFLYKKLRECYKIEADYYIPKETNEFNRIAVYKNVIVMFLEDTQNNKKELDRLKGTKPRLYEPSIMCSLTDVLSQMYNKYNVSNNFGNILGKMNNKNKIANIMIDVQGYITLFLILALVLIIIIAVALLGLSWWAGIFYLFFNFVLKPLLTLFGVV